MTSSVNRIGHHKIHFTELDSTNAAFRRMMEKEEVEEGTLISADFQSEGIGQYGRKWNSQADKNVMISFLLKPVFLKISDQFLLNVCTSLAVVNVISNECTDVHVKWPNDIYVGKRKIAGILIQNFIQANTIKNSIIGIGLNVNQTVWPDDIPKATSMALESVQKFKIDNIIDQICEQMNIMYEGIRHNPESLSRKYQNILFNKNEIAAFRLGELVFEGIVRGVDNIGRLIVEQEGVRKSYSHGEIVQLIR